MSFLDATYEILKEAGELLHYREIARRALERGLIRTKGRTPETTLRAQRQTFNGMRFAAI